SRCRKAVSRSSRQSRLTTRRPSQTHSGLPAGPASTRDASAISSIFFCPSLASLAASVGGLASGGLPLAPPLWAKAAPTPRTRPATQSAAQAKRNPLEKRIVPPVMLKAPSARVPVSVGPDWVTNTACLSPVAPALTDLERSPPGPYAIEPPKCPAAKFDLTETVCPEFQRDTRRKDERQDGLAAARPPYKPGRTA